MNQIIYTSSPFLVEDKSAEEFAPVFTCYPKVPRLNRESVITEKIDGTNAQILITPEGRIYTGSRGRWISPQNDNHGFSRWVEDHHEEIKLLGPGRHFGEWWGSGINRGYGLRNGVKRLSLFNTERWCVYGDVPRVIPSLDPTAPVRVQQVLPPCVGLVPILWRGLFCTEDIKNVLTELRLHGSVAAPGFDNPEGIVVFHTAANHGFKVTLDKDGQPKGLPARPEALANRAPRVSSSPASSP